MSALKGWYNDDDPSFWMTLTAEHGDLEVEVVRGLLGKFDDAQAHRTTLADALARDAWGTSRGTAYGNVRLVLDGNEIPCGEYDYVPAWPNVMVSLDEHGRPCVEVLTRRGEYDRHLLQTSRDASE